MTLAGFPLSVAIGGALVLAAILYLLQRLRQQRRAVALPTAALWRQAVQAERTPVLGARFRYWLAFLLALAIGLLLWLAAAHPVATPVGGAAQLMYFDASAAMVAGGEEAQAKRALLADARALDAAHRDVYLGDARGTRLLARGESASLLSSRLDGVRAGARPSAFAAWLAGRVRDVPPGAPVTVRYYGSPAAARAAAAGLPANVRLSYGYLTAPVPDNRGIVALGTSPAVDGAWGRADVVVTVAAARAAAVPGAGDLRFTLGGGDYLPARIVAAGAGTFLLRGVPADGRVLAVSLRDGDGFPADDTAALRIPDRRPIRVAVLPGVPAAVRAAVAADDAFVPSAPGDAQAVVRAAGERAPPGIPALVITPAAAQGDAFLFTAPGGASSRTLAVRLDDFGLAQIDAAAIADRLGRAVSVRMEDGATPAVSAWTELFAPQSPFVRSATLPLFVSRSLRWLAAPDAWTPYARAGAPLPDQSALYGLGDRGDAARRALFGDPAADDVGAAAGAVSLTDRATTLAAAQPADMLTVSPLGQAVPDLAFTLLVLGALLLLALEWLLFQRGWMP